MGIADSMKGITENIIGSYDVRVNALRDLVRDTRKTIRGFAADRKGLAVARKQMSAEQSERLADFVKGLEKSVGSMLKEFQASHKEMSAEQGASLAAFVKSIACLLYTSPSPRD